MTTPAIILGLLLVPFLLMRILPQVTRKEFADSRLAGCIGITLVFCFTGVGHFIKTEPMAEMLPTWVPWRIPLVYVTGVGEIAAAIALLIPRLRKFTGLGLVFMLVALLPVNVYAAMNQIGMGGHQWGRYTC
jgi:uncharacterized membrane protein